MTPKELKAHKIAHKQLVTTPVFAPLKRNKLPKPLKGIGGPRIQSTGILDVSSDHSVVMYWRDGQILTDRSFYGHLFCKLADGNLSPLFEFHWHPCHKGLHCKMPCKTVLNYTNRMLPGAPELSLKLKQSLDPKIPADRQKLVIYFCKSCGILLPDSDPITKTLW